MDIYRCNHNCGCMRCRYRGTMWGVVFITGGVLLFLNTLDIGGLDAYHTWPILLIVIGVMLMLQRTASTDGHVQPAGLGQPFPMPPMPGTQPSSPSSEVRHE